MAEAIHEERLLFAYGTLMFPAIIHAVIGRIPGQRPAVIEGYRRLVVAGELFPALIANDESDESVEGVLYDNITPEEWKRLIAFEDPFYKLESVDVHCAGREVRAVAFILPPALNSLLSEKVWEPDAFRESFLERWASRTDP
jgi:gamma-glutamylcyclotransferase (GGCT)/AIG2-like uncharacterized protein YtfP